MTNKFLLAIIAFLSISLYTQSQKLKVKRKGVTPMDVTKRIPDKTSLYSIDQFAGRWQEINRKTSKTNTNVSFKDTLFYNFSGDKVQSSDGVNMSLKGEAAIDPGNVLIAAADVFTIRSMTNNQVVLDDGDYLHTLVRKNKFWTETFPTNYVEPEKFTTPVTVSASSLLGKWKVYRRDAKPGSENNRTLIRLLNITDIKNASETSGEVTFYQTEKLETSPCKVSLNGGSMRITTSKDSWNFNVYKADKNDLVFGDTGLMYYCKPL